MPEVKAVAGKAIGFGMPTPHTPITLKKEGHIWWQHIRWKPTSPCKLWKLQSESNDVDPTGRPEEVGGVMCKITFANHASHLP
jgi:hypothetical protein